MIWSTALRATLLVLTALILTACSNSDDAKEAVDEVVSLLPNTSTLQVHVREGVALEQGEQFTIDVTYVDALGLKFNGNDDASFSISDTSLITTTATNNMFEATGGGTVTVEVEYRDLTQQIELSIAPSEITSVVIELDGFDNFAASQRASVRATAFHSNGLHEDITNKVSWSSSDTTILDFDANSNEFTALKDGSVEITATLADSQGATSTIATAKSGGADPNTPIVNIASSDTFTLSVTVDTDDLAEIQLHSEKGSVLVVDMSSKMSATAVHTNGNHFDFAKSVTWSSSDDTILTISDSGVVKAVAPGFATISATHNGLVDSYRIRVSDVDVSLDSIVVSSVTGSSLPLGRTQLTAVGVYSDGTRYDLTNEATWSVADSAIASVGSTASFSAGEVNGLSAGSTTISASFGDQSGDLALTFLSAGPTGITLYAPSQPAYVGADLQYVAKAFYDDGTEKDVSGQVTWSSSEANVANISNAKGSHGLAHLIQAGSSTITATLNGFSDTSIVTVQAVPVSSITVKPTSASVRESKDVRFTVTATFQDGTTRDVSSTAGWKSSDTVIATVKDGLVHGVSAGQADITATFKGQRSTVPVTVTAAQLSTLVITAANSSFDIGDSTQLTATGTLENGATVDDSASAHWSSSDHAIVSVSATGKATGHAAGTVTITASLDGIDSNAIQLTVTTPPPVTGAGSGGSGSGGSGSGSGGSTQPPGAVTTPQAPSGTVTATTLPTVKQFAYTETASKTIPGTSAEMDASANNCDGNIKADDTIGSLAIVARKQTGVPSPSCWTDGNYNYSNFPVSQGTLSDSSGDSYDAYHVGVPTKPVNFAASGHYLAFKPAAAGTYVLYTFDGHFSKVETLTATSTDWLVSNTEVSKLNATTTYLILPDGMVPSVLHSISSDLVGAEIADNGLGKVYHYELAIAGGRIPLDRADFSAGPADAGNRYGQNRYLHPVELSDGKLGIVWQDRSSYKVYLTKFDRRGTSTTVDLPLSTGPSRMLGAAGADSSGALYYMLFEAGNPDPNYNKSSDPTKVLSVLAVKSDEAGALLVSKELNDSANSLNATTFGDIASSLTANDGQYGNTVSLNVAGGEVGIIYSRLHAQTSDGLNHQGADAIVLDAGSLAIKVNHGQTSGHSFSNVMNTTGTDQFIAIDLGDNYPRGINFHRFNGSSKDSRVVYTFKTHHGYVASHDGRGPFDPYGVDVTGRQMYKWSNDNNTYTELGGVEETNSGYLVVFASEHDTNDNVLNNGATGDNLNLVDARNVGFIKVSPSFESASGSGNEVSDDLVITQSGSAPETGEFYTFDGLKRGQRVTGIRWLTQYTDKATENASRVRLSERSDGNFTVMWEVWTPTEYVETRAMVIDGEGAEVTPSVVLNGVRLNRRDDLFSIGDKMYSIVGNKAAGTLEITEIVE
ncbi:MAG: Ig-like domain-containing protein [Pseudomonadales bacterium]